MTRWELMAWALLAGLLVANCKGRETLSGAGYATPDGKPVRAIPKNLTRGPKEGWK